MKIPHTRLADHPFSTLALGALLTAIGIALLPIPLAMHPGAPPALLCGACLAAGGIAMFQAAGRLSSRNTDRRSTSSGDVHAP